MGGERIFLGLGGNQPGAAATLSAAVAEIAALPDTRVVARSATIRSPPWGVVEQPDFHNCVIEITSELDPFGLLDAVKAIETRLGRVATYRWGPRVIDIDIIVYGVRRIATDRLTVPHPHGRERDFVLRPLAEIAPEIAAALG